MGRGIIQIYEIAYNVRSHVVGARGQLDVPASVKEMEHFCADGIEVVGIKGPPFLPYQ